VTRPTCSVPTLQPATPSSIKKYRKQLIYQSNCFHSTRKEVVFCMHACMHVYMTWPLLLCLLLPTSQNIRYWRVKTQETTVRENDLYTPHFTLPTNSPPTHQPHSILSYASKTLNFGTKFENIPGHRSSSFAKEYGPAVLVVVWASTSRVPVTDGQPPLALIMILINTRVPATVFQTLGLQRFFSSSAILFLSFLLYFIGQQRF
jgi:hypothetical protein